MFVGVDVGVLVGVLVGVMVALGVGVLVAVGVALLVEVAVGVGVGVVVGVDVGVLVGVAVGVLVGVAVGVGVAVLVGVDVAVLVGVAVAVAVGVPAAGAARYVTMSAAQSRDGLRVPVAAYVPTALTMRYSGLVVMLEAALLPVVPTRVSAVNAGSAVKVSPDGPWTPIAPTSNSSAWAVLAVDPEDGAVLLPVLVLV